MRLRSGGTELAKGRWFNVIHAMLLIPNIMVATNFRSISNDTDPSGVEATAIGLILMMMWREEISSCMNNARVIQIHMSAEASSQLSRKMGIS
jgi:hypothetical protein